MPECANDKLRELLPDLINDQLSDAMRAEVREHAANCPVCSRELVILGHVRSAVRASKPDTSRIVARIPAYRPRPVWRRVWQSQAMRAAAVVLLLVGGGYVAREIGRDDTTPAAPTTELAVGVTLSGITESDLRELVDELATLDAVMSAETDVIVMPAVGQGGL